MSTVSKNDEKINVKKDPTIDVAFKKLLNVLVQRGVLKLHELEEILKEIK